jgi:hypothetical protein
MSGEPIKLDWKRRPRKAAPGPIKADTGWEFLKTVLFEALYLLLFPLIVVGSVLFIVGFWVYLVCWCGWRGGPE